MQADQLAEVCEPNAFAVTRDLFEDREGAAERLDTDPLAVVGVVVDIGLRWLHQPGDGGFARTGRLLAGLCLSLFLSLFSGLLLGTRSQRIRPPRHGTDR